MATRRRSSAALGSPLVRWAAALVLAAVALTSATSGSPPRAQAAVPRAVERCADLVVLGARASGQRLTPDDRGMGTEVHALAGAAVARLPGGADVRLAGVPYPATPTSLGTTAYTASVRAGTTVLRARLARLLADCPRTEVALAGFSQGAHVVHEALAGSTLDAADARRVVAVALVADPTYDAATSNAHQVSYGVGGVRRSGLLGPGPSLPPLLAGRTIDLCHPDDLVCSFGGPKGEIWMARWAGRQHTAFYEQPEVVARGAGLLAAVIRAHAAR